MSPRLSLLVPLLAALLVPVPASAAPTSRDVGFARWEGAPAFRTGAFAGLRLKHGTLVIKDATKTRTYHGHTYSMGTWTSAATSPGFAFTQLVARWLQPRRLKNRATWGGDKW